MCTTFYPRSLSFEVAETLKQKCSSHILSIAYKTLHLSLEKFNLVRLRLTQAIIPQDIQHMVVQGSHLFSY